MWPESLDAAVVALGLLMSRVKPSWEGLTRRISKTVSEPAGFEELYEQHAKPLWRYVAKVSGSTDLADDLTQEAFVRFWRRGCGIQSTRQKAYLYRIATNLIMDHFRRRKRGREWMETRDVPEAQQPAVTTDLQKEVRDVLATLGPRERSLLWMAHAEGFRHREIAEALGVGEASVRVLLHRARRKLAAALRERGMEPGGAP